MILSVLYLLFYAAAGVLIGRCLFASESLPRRLWLGLTLGLFGSIWLPSLFSFVLGFGALSHLLGVLAMALLTAVCLYIRRKSDIYIGIERNSWSLCIRYLYGKECGWICAITNG